MQHKWHKEIKKWADGAVIQFKDKTGDNEWIDCVDNYPSWDVRDFVKYRIKPQPKEPQYINVYGWLENGNITFKQYGPYLGKIKLEVDDD
jgi:hypothetical protein